MTTFIKEGGRYQIQSLPINREGQILVQCQGQEELRCSNPSEQHINNVLLKIHLTKNTYEICLKFNDNGQQALVDYMSGGGKY
ncbi:hypothetical protein Trydic_g7822 [Trypoxylus dichotomus]